MSYAEANQVKFIHAHQIAKNTIRYGPTPRERVAVLGDVSASCAATWAIATTNVRSNSSSSGLETRCASSVVRPDMRTRKPGSGPGLALVMTPSWSAPR